MGLNFYDYHGFQIICVNVCNLVYIGWLKLLGKDIDGPYKCHVKSWMLDNVPRKKRRISIHIATLTWKTGIMTSANTRQFNKH